MPWPIYFSLSANGGARRIARLRWACRTENIQNPFSLEGKARARFFFAAAAPALFLQKLVFVFAAAFRLFSFSQCENRGKGKMGGSILEKQGKKRFFFGEGGVLFSCFYFGAGSKVFYERGWCYRFWCFFPLSRNKSSIKRCFA